MTGPDRDAFFAVHSGLDREGPGTAADVAWACRAAGTPSDALICDAACGTGADVAALRRAAPAGRVAAFDRHLPFVADAAARSAGDAGVTVTQGVLVSDGTGLPDPAALGPFDLLWCAGAVYFVGVEAALRAWRPALRPGGAAAFSEPVTWGPPDEETRAFWGGEVLDERSLDAAVEAAGWAVVARSRVADEGWRLYHDGLERRCAAFDRCEAEPIRAAAAEARREARDWERLRGRLGYALRVVRPR